MFETLVNAFKIKEIRHKIYFTILLLIVYRLAAIFPFPGIDAEALATQITGNDFLSIMNGITGGALANGTLFAMGIGPYINASIIMQLLTVGIPALERLSKQGEDGRKEDRAVHPLFHDGAGHHPGGRYPGRLRRFGPD